MVHIAFYTKDYSNFHNVKKLVEKECACMNCSYVYFEHKMDLLDFLNTSRPQNCAVFFEAETFAEAVEISEKVVEIDPKYRFNLFCGEEGDIEEMFYKGVSYFIKKPYSEQIIHRCISVVSRFFNDQEGKILTLKTKKGMDVINLSDIIYIMSDKRKVVFFLTNGEKSFYYKLDEIETMLEKSFMRCHQSYIVNMKKIKMFDDDGLELDNNFFVPISRKKYFSCKKEYLSYISGGKIM